MIEQQNDTVQPGPREKTMNPKQDMNAASAATDCSPSFRDVFLIMVDGPTGWRRVGPVYRSKEEAKGWVSFVKASWHGMTTRTRRVRIPLGPDGRPTEAAVKQWSEEFNIDLKR